MDSTTLKKELIEIIIKIKSKHTRAMCKIQAAYH